MSSSENWSSKLLSRSRTLVRSMGVGAVATLTDLLVLTLLANELHLGPRVASLPALASGIVVQFVGNKFFAFEDTSKRWAEQAALFLAVEALGFAANLVLFDVAVRFVPLPLVAVRLLTTNAVYFGLCLPLWSRIFARNRTNASIFVRGARGPSGGEPLS